MKRFVIPFTILLVLSLTWIVRAGILTSSVSRWSVGSGDVTTGGEYRLFTISGQPIAGSQSGGDFNLIWGHWQPESEPTLYLPMIFQASASLTDSSELRVEP